jgi:hypothetical protein
MMTGEVEAEPPQQVDCDEEDEEGSDAGRADDDGTLSWPECSSS